MRRARFTPAGVHLWRGRSEPRFVPWSEISPIILRRLDHDRRDFRWLLFRPPGSFLHILLTNGERSGAYWDSAGAKPLAEGWDSWKGTSAEVLAAFLEKHVPPNLLQVDALRGAPLNLAECERRLAEVEKKYLPLLKVLRLWPVLWPIGLVVLSIWALIIGGPNALKSNWGFGVFGVFLLESFRWVFCRGLERQFKKERSELEAWREALSSGQLGTK
jgi:hypothetical protein